MRGPRHSEGKRGHAGLMTLDVTQLRHGSEPMSHDKLSYVTPSVMTQGP